MEYIWKSERIRTIDQHWVTLYAVPITRLIELSNQLNLAHVIMAKNVGLEQLLTLPDFQVLIDGILSEYKLTRSQLDLDTLQSLILTTIPKVNDLLVTEGKGNSEGEGMTLYEYEAKTVTGLVNMGLASNLIEARLIADSYPHDKLRSYLNARLLQLDPEFESKQQQKVTEKELLEELKQDLSTGNLFKDTDAFRSGLKNAIGGKNVNIFEL